MMNIAVIIPAYNEESNLPGLFASLIQVENDKFKLFPIVINDCSTDKTAEVCRLNKVDFIDLSVNLGIGGAVQTGMIYACERGFDFAIQMDGDGQHPPKEISKLVEKYLEGKSNVVIGSRFIDRIGFQSTGIRRVGIRYLSFVIKVFTGLTITDTTSGFRLFDRKALEAIKKYYPDEYPEPEAIIYFNKLGLKITETPVLMLERQGGRSSISFLNSIYYFWKVSLGIFYSYLKS